MDTAEGQAVRPRPPFWIRLSITAGNLVQVTGLIIGGLVMYLAAHLDVSTLLRVILMILGWLVIYICCHAISHWIVGRLVGIRFQGQGVRGTDHPEEYGPGMRQVMQITPMFTVMTERTSMHKARPIARALMFAAGETGSIIFPTIAAFYAWQSQTPGGLILFIVAVLGSVFAAVTTSVGPKGDYAKARKALQTKHE